MSDVSKMLGFVYANLAQEGVRYFRGTTSDQGASDGSSVVDENAPGLNSAWVDCELTLVGSSDFPEVTKHVEGFTASSGTYSFTNNVFPERVGYAVAYEVTEKGKWRSHEIRKHIINAANFFLKNAPAEMLWDYALRVTRTGTTANGYGKVTLPEQSTRVQRILGVWTNDAQPVDVLNGNETDWLDNPYIDASTEKDYVGFFRGRDDSSEQFGRFIYKPPISETFEFACILYVSGFTAAGAWDVPEALWTDIAKIATAYALYQNNRTLQGDNWMKQVITAQAA